MYKVISLKGAIVLLSIVSLYFPIKYLAVSRILPEMPGLVNTGDISFYFHLAKSKGIPREFIRNLLLISTVFDLYLIKSIQLQLLLHLNHFFKYIPVFLSKKWEKCEIKVPQVN